MQTTSVIKRTKTNYFKEITKKKKKPRGVEPSKGFHLRIQIVEIKLISQAVAQVTIHK